MRELCDVRRFVHGLGGATNAQRRKVNDLRRLFSRRILWFVLEDCADTSAPPTLMPQLLEARWLQSCATAGACRDMRGGRRVDGCLDGAERLTVTPLQTGVLAFVVGGGLRLEPFIPGAAFLPAVLRGLTAEGAGVASHVASLRPEHFLSPLETGLQPVR